MKKVRLEFEDSEGGKFKLTFEGKITKDKVLKIMDLIDSINKEEKEILELPSLDTSFGKVWRLIEERFSLGSFDSSELTEAYEDRYNEPIKLSTLSTYLARLVDKGILSRRRIGNTWIYKKIRIQPTQL
ncbi:MAG: hypothetical protein QXX95_07205 [Nitrososphaerales archaeon]